MLGCVPDLQVELLVPQDIVDDHYVGGDVQEHPVLPIHQAVHSQAAVVAKHPGEILQGRGISWLSAARTKKAHEVCGVMEESRAGVLGALCTILLALCLLILTRAWRLLSLFFLNSIPGDAAHTKLKEPLCCVCFSL